MSKHKRSQQSKFNGEGFRHELRFGGTLTKKANGRGARPISSKDPMHLVLKSTKARGVCSFIHSKNHSRVNSLVRKTCEKYGVKLIEFSNNGNHLHLLARMPSRMVYLRFIRALTGHLALLVSGASKLRKLKAIFGKRGFWDFRPFTRVVRSRRGFKVARDYVILNQLEAMEIIPKRVGRLRDLEPDERQWFSR